MELRTDQITARQCSFSYCHFSQRKQIDPKAIRELAVCVGAQTHGSTGAHREGLNTVMYLITFFVEVAIVATSERH